MPWVVHSTVPYPMLKEPGTPRMLFDAGAATACEKCSTDATMPSRLALGSRASNKVVPSIVDS